MMRPIATGFPLIAPLALVAACHGASQGQAPQAGASAAASPTGPAEALKPAAAPEPAGHARKASEKSALYQFDYSYPAAADAIPALKAWLEADLAKQRDELISDARDGAADAKQNAYPYMAYSSAQDWHVVTNLPGWLSLSALVYSFSGGAHGNSGFATVLWDRSAGVRRMPIDLFYGKKALSAAIRAPFCAELNRQRAKRRGAPVDPASTDDFDQCIDPAEETVILGSAGHQAFDRIGILVPPYEAGSYAEGSYEVTLPVTPAIIAAVKPEYRASFAPGR